MGFEFVSNYRDNETLRASFNRLAGRVFDLSFENWHARGLWDETYICYSYVCSREIVANVSASTVIITRNGRRCNAVQIGTVMTDPQYRNKGLATGLIRRIISKYENKCDFIYLFANQTVLDFYPKFGFKPCKEYVFYSTRQARQCNQVDIEFRRLNLSYDNDYRRLCSLSKSHLPVSQKLGVKNHGIFMFNCLYGFPENIYYSDKLNTAVIFTISSNTLDIYDIISEDKINVSELVNLLPATEMVRLHFTPDETGYDACPSGDPDNTLFVRPGDFLGSDAFIFPETSHA